MKSKQEDWAEKLKALAQRGGGTTKNGWTVQTKTRQSGRTAGRREICIRSADGHSFRSIAQASLALAQGRAFKPERTLKQQHTPIKVKLKTGKGRSGHDQREKEPGKKPKRERGKEVKKRSKSCDRSDGGRSAAQPAESRGSEKEHPVFAKLLRKARRHISRIRREMDILEVYDAEGWRGSNRDKLKPRAEMQRAHTHMAASKEALKEIVQRCEEGEGTAIPAKDYDSDGGLDNSSFFCAICRKNDSTDENDLVLCDGPCSRAYHERCCIPNFVSAALSEESDWLCPACYTKDEVMDLVNEEFGTRYEIHSSAAELFSDDPPPNKGSSPAQKQKAASLAGTWANLLGATDLVSSDTDDDSYRGGEAGSPSSPADCEGAHVSRSLGASFASTSSHEHSSRSSEEVLQSEKRQRVNIDYVAMNSEMFGDDEDEDSDKDYG